MSDTRPEYLKEEEKFINILLNNKDCVKKWLSGNVGIKCFDHGHEIVLKALAWASGEGVVLTRQSFKSFAEEQVNTPAEAAAQVSVFNRIFMQIAKPDDYPMLLNKIKQNYVQRRSAEIMNEYNRERQIAGYESANESMVKKMQALSNDFQDTKTVYLDLGSARDTFMLELEARRKNPTQRLICNIPEIDSTMAVGFKPGTLTIFCAAPGTFKTTVMMNVSLNIFKHSGVNVMYIPLEGGADMFMQKLVSRETMIPANKIEQSHLLTDEEIKKVDEEFTKWRDLSNRFKILKPGDRAKCSAIRHEIESRLAYYCPRILVVDYLDNVIADGRHNRDDLDIRDKLEELIRMGDNFGFAVVTAAKLSREAIKRLRDTKDGKQDLDTTDVHGGQEFGGQATTLYGQIRNPNTPNTALDFFCMKSRFGSPVFPNNSTKGRLNIQPEIGLITSDIAKGIGWDYSNVKDAVSMVTNIPPPPLDTLPEADNDSPF